MNSTAAPEASIDTGDRLSFTIFVAAAVHALLLFGITFSIDRSDAPAPTLEITLATHQSKNDPIEAEHLAQFSQQASGTGDTNQLLSTDRLAAIDDAVIREQLLTPQQKSSIPHTANTPTAIITTGSSQQKVALHENSQQPEEFAQDGDDQQNIEISAEIASLRAKLDQQRRAIAKKPRLRRITSVATRSSLDAEYLHRWTSKVEFVGNNNFPQKAINDQIVGKLRLATQVRSDGTIQNVEILQSSGHNVLDQAALQIVHLAAPYPPFPMQLRKEVDVLEIIRTWRFEKDNYLSSF